jgi:hypothetical protein
LGIAVSMSIRTYKIITGILLLLVLLVAWRWFRLYRQMVAAAFISHQCEMVETASGLVSNTTTLASDLQFLTTYYEGEGKSLAGSPIGRVVQRDYQHAVASNLAQFRLITTNDLGSDPRAWIQKYGEQTRAQAD